MAEVAFRKEWESSGDIARLLKTLNDATLPNESGSISFKTHDFDELFFLLADGLIFPKSITRADVSAISYRSFLDLRKHGPVNKDRLLKEVGIRVGQLLGLPKKTYTMWSKMRLKNMAFAKASHFLVDGVRIRTAAHLPKWLRVDEHCISGFGRIKTNILPFFGYVIFSVEARNEEEAAERIFAASDLFFAVVNTAWRSIELWIQRRPAASLWLGPNQFFFRGRRFIGEEKTWYNPDYEKDTWELFPKDAREFGKRTRYFRQVLDNIEDHPLREPIVKSLILISEGMISRDLSFRLMRLWSAAEVLYAIESEKTNINKLVDRLTFASKEEAWLDKLKLYRCYHLRNSYVHHGSRDNDDSALIRHLQELLLHHLYYFIFQGADISSHREFMAMIDMPSDESALDRLSRAIERRRNLLRTGRHKVS